jgi:hypothetical protein
MSANAIKKMVWSGIALLQTMTVAASPASAWTDPFVDLQAHVVSEQVLDSMRGGFTSADGLEISFGIEQAVLIDGILQVVKTFSASSTSVTNMLPQQVSDLRSTAMTPDAIRSQVNTIVIQNSLDQKVIDSITLINATVTSLGLSRERSLLHSLQQQQINARH